MPILDTFIFCNFLADKFMKIFQIFILSYRELRVVYREFVAKLSNQTEHIMNEIVFI